MILYFRRSNGLHGMQYDPPNLSEPYERILTEKGMAKGN